MWGSAEAWVVGQKEPEGIGHRTQPSGLQGEFEGGVDVFDRFLLRMEVNLPVGQLVLELVRERG